MGWLQDLRKAYSHIPFLSFVQIIENYGERDELLTVLDEAEAKARREEDLAEQGWKELGNRLRASDLHHDLAIIVSPDVDLEHSQAILTYAFIMPGRKEMYAGTNVTAAEKVWDNTRNKLLTRFSEHKFEAALRYLVAQGVLCVAGTKARRAYSLNLGGGSCKVTPHGRQILRACNDMARSK